MSGAPRDLHAALGRALAAVVGLGLAASPSHAQVVVVPAAGVDHPEAVALHEVSGERETAFRRVMAFLGNRAPADSSVVIHVYPSPIEKARITGVERALHMDTATGKLHAVVEGSIRGDRMGGEAGLLVERALGAPLQPVLEAGIPAYFSQLWGGKGYEHWAARFHEAGLVPPLDRMLSAEWLDETSPLLSEPIAALLVAHLVGRWSREGFLDRYPIWDPDPSEVEAMQPGWEAFLDATARAMDAEGGSELVPLRVRATALPRAQLRGVNYAHEGYRRYDGYLSERSDASLQRLADLGANAVAVLPYAFMSEPDEPGPLRIPTRPGSETDPAVAHAVRSAADLGMTVILKPHIWLRGSWPGEIRMNSEEDWDVFFTTYERWILHYALLAEIHGVPILSVGVEMAEATRGQERHWRTLVEKVRSVYSGALVYAANWGDEFDNLPFWDVFDYLGVDAYYPLSDDPAATDRELREGAEAMLDRVERIQRRYDKPVLFTEIGFASTESPWVRPWESHLTETADPEHQLRSYRAVLEAMQARTWIAGALWWEWPSDLRRAGSDARGYMPAGKPAEAVLTQWFRTLPHSAPAR